MEIVESRTPSGVSVLTANVAGEVHAALVFGVARRDEKLSVRGVTAVVVELIMAHLRPLTVQSGWTFTVNEVAFTAHGSAEAVAGHLGRVAAALRDLDHVGQPEIDEAVARIVRLKRHTDEVMSSMFTARFGLVDIGLEGIASLRAASLTPEVIVDWARAWFVVENAAVVSSSPLPAALDLDLGSATARRARDRALPKALVERPALVHVTEVDMTVSLLMTTRQARAVWRALLEEIHTDLVDVLGVAETVRAKTLQLDETFSVVDLMPQGATTRQGLTALIRSIQRVAREGVSESALALAREKSGTAFDDRSDHVRDGLLVDAGARLRGFPTIERDLRRDAALEVTSDDVARAVDSALATMIVGVDRRTGDLDRLEGAAIELGLAVERRDAQRAVDPSAWRRRPWRARVYRSRRHATEPDRRAAVTSDGVLIRSKAGTKMVRYADLVIVGEELPGLVTLVARDGGSVLFGRRSWPEAFLRAIVAAAPEAIVEEW